MKLGQAIKRRNPSANVRDRSLRCDIPDGRRRVDAYLMSRIREIDGSLELIWHSMAKKWVLYRMIVAGVSPSADVLLKVETLDREPGSWLVGWLQQNDITRGGSVSLARGASLSVDADFMAMERHEQLQQSELDSMYHELANDLRGAMVGRKVVSLQTGKEVDTSKLRLALP